MRFSDIKRRVEKLRKKHPPPVFDWAALEAGRWADVFASMGEDIPPEFLIGVHDWPDPIEERIARVLNHEGDAPCRP